MVRWFNSISFIMIVFKLFNTDFRVEGAAFKVKASNNNNNIKYFNLILPPVNA